MFSSYDVLGLRLHSNLPIQGLSDIRPDLEPTLHVWFDSRPAWLGELPEAGQTLCYNSPYQNACGEPNLRVWRITGGDQFRFLYGDGTEFIVERRGTEIWATWPNTATLEDTVTYLLGPVLGFVLRLRGCICLHASAVAIGDQAIALLGPAGAGKSTTAAAFAHLGHPVLSDDIVALRPEDESLWVPPGYPRVCLWPDSVKSLLGSPEALPLLTPNWDKRYLALNGENYRFQSVPLPLSAVYLLGERSPEDVAPRVEALPSKDGLMTLVANTYVWYLLDKAMRANEFRFLSRLVARVPIRRVTPHTAPSSLAKLCEVIRNDFLALSTSVSTTTDSI